jgi:hypothetical protein
VSVAELPAVWRARAEELGAYAPAAATAWGRAAAELKAALLAAANEPLKLRDAARESGYSEDHLGRLVKEGKLVNVGRKRAPRVRRSDLPRKARAGTRASGKPSFASIVRDGASTRAGRS